MAYKIIPKAIYNSSRAFTVALLGCVILGAFSAFISLVLVQNFSSPVFSYLLIVLLSLLTIGPLVHRLTKRSFDLVEPSGWFALYYFTLFGIRAIWVLEFGSPILGLEAEPKDAGLINAALVVATIGLGVFWLGYYLPFGCSMSRAVPKLPGVWKRSLGMPVAASCLAVGWVLRLFLIYNQAGSLGSWLALNKYEQMAQVEGITYLTIFSSLATTGLFVFLVLARVYNKRIYWLIFLCSSPLELLYWFFSGSRAQFIFFLLSVMVVFYMTSDRTHRTSLRYGLAAALFILLLVFLFPLFSFIRGGLGELDLLLPRLETLWAQPLALLELVLTRQHGLDSLAIIMDRVPRYEPYALDWQLRLLIAAWIPRQLWPEKPTVSMGKILYQSMFPQIFHPGTAVAGTLPGTLYWGYGYLGVLFGMLFIGILWRFLRDYLVLPKGNLSNILVVAMVFQSFFILAEQDMISLLTMHLPRFLLTAIVAIVLGRVKKYSPKGCG